MAQTTRTFVAIEVPESLGAKLTRLQSLLGAEATAVRWVRTPSFHLTLAFLGDVADRDLNEVCRTVEAAAAPIEPFELRVEGVGAFPDPRKPRTIWAGLTGPGVETLLQIQSDVASALSRIGYRPDARFHPHVTLGRLKEGRGPAPDLTALFNQYRTWSAGSFAVREAVTFSSNPTPEGPIYAPLGTAPLAGGKAQPSA